MSATKPQIRAAFSRAAPHYNEVAVLQRELAQRILERLELFRIAPRRILDLGCGTGFASHALQRRYPEAQVIALDFALPMLHQLRRHDPTPHCLCADMDHIPLAAGSIDLIVSNATLQWSSDLATTLQGLRHILAPNGVLIFTTFGPDTLKELRQAWASVDQQRHVNDFLDIHEVGDSLLHNGFSNPVLDIDRLTLTYAHARDLMRDLKQLGAHRLAAPDGTRRTLTGKARLAAVERAYEAYRREGCIPASYEVIHGHGWVV